MNVSYMIISKWKLFKLVEENFVMGWDDLCMLIIVGMCCCGYLVQVIVDFCRGIGLMKCDNVIEIECLEYYVCQELNKIFDWVMVVFDLFKVVIINYLEG